MKNMMTKNSNKTVFFLIAIIFILFFAGNVFSGVLVSTSVDKEEIMKNEVAYFTIKIFNDTNSTVNNLALRMEGTNGIIFLENNSAVLLKEIESINSLEGKEIKLRFKVNEVHKETAELFVYYGQEKEQKYVSGTFVNTKEKPVLIKTSAEKKQTDSGQEIFVNFEIHNLSKESIYGVAADVSAPAGFEIKTSPFFTEELPNNDSLEKEFEILAPIAAEGVQTIIFTYGYFDVNGPHYFEETFDISFERTNNLFLAVIGLIILAIAIFVYISQKGSNKKEKVKGTGK